MMKLLRRARRVIESDGRISRAKTNGLGVVLVPVVARVLQHNGVPINEQMVLEAAVAMLGLGQYFSRDNQLPRDRPDADDYNEE